MSKKNNLKQNAKKVIMRVAIKAASEEANSACCFLAHQPKEPQSVKNLRKF